MECPYCRGSVGAAALFCGHCGKALPGSAPVRETAADVPAGPQRSGRKIVATIVATLTLAGSIAAPIWKNPDLLDKVVTLAGISAPAPTVVALQPAGPIIEVPPAILFRGQEDTGSGLADTPSAASEASAQSAASAPPASVVDRAKRDLAARPNDPKVLNDAGALIWASGDKAQGAELLAKAHEVAPNDPVISYNLARVWYEQGRRDEAVRLAEEAAQRQRDFDEARLLIAAAAVQQQDYVAAEQQLGQLTNRLHAIGLTITGTVQMFRGQHDAALASFQQAAQVAQRGNSAASLYNLGLAYQQKGDLANAQTYYRQALGQNPQLAPAHYNLGTVRSSGGDLQQALESLHEASRLDPRNQSFMAALERLAAAPGESDDRIVGLWAVQTSTFRMTGTLQGEPVSQTVSLPIQGQLSLTKAGSGSYRADQPPPNGTTFQLQPNGSYRAFTAPLPPQVVRQFLPPGTSQGSVVTSFWVRGDTLIGDALVPFTGPGTSAVTSVAWKAYRLDANGNSLRPVANVAKGIPVQADSRTAPGAAPRNNSSGNALPAAGPPFAGEWIATSQYGGVYRYQIAPDMTVNLLATIEEADEDSWREDNVPDPSEIALGTLVQGLGKTLAPGEAPPDCPAVEPRNQQEALLLVGGRQMSGCWERQKDGSLVFVSQQTPGSGRSGSGEPLTSQWNRFSRDRENPKVETKRLSASVLEMRTYGTVPPPETGSGAFSREVVNRLDFGGTPPRMEVTVYFWGSANPVKTVRYTLARPK